MEQGRKLSVLVADDDPADHEQFCRALAASPHPTSISSVYNGMNLIDYLRLNAGSKKKGDLPDLILTDLYMPFAGGLQVLKQIKGHADFGNIPIYVFSRNDDEVVRRNVINYGASGFHRKPDDYNELSTIISEILSRLPGVTN